MLCGPVRMVRAQAEDDVRFGIRIESDTDNTTAVIWSDRDSLSFKVARVVDSLRASGYFFAEADTSGDAAGKGAGRDSAAGDVRGADDAGEGIAGKGAAEEVGTAAVVRRGPLVRIGSIRFTRVDPERGQRLRAAMQTEAGDAFVPERFESDIERILVQLEREGLPLAAAHIEAIEPMNGSVEQLTVTIGIDVGPRVSLVRIDLLGADRTRSSLVARLAEIEVGRPLTAFESERIRRRIEESGLFESVGSPELVIDSDTTAVLRIPIEEGDPGTFDLVLGYLPPRGSEASGSIIGNGHLSLRNLFGRGQMLSLRLHRLPGHLSRVDVAASDPYVLGLPIGLEAAFQGLEQDSTYGKRTFGGDVRYYLAPGMDIIGGFSREQTGSGQAGLRLGPLGRQVVPNSDAWFLGIGTRISSVDRPVNPTRGLFVEMNLESGRKRRTERRIIDADTTRETTLLEQKRLQATGRYFIPTFERQVIVVGGDAGVLLSNEYDRSDLFRFGGATSLRGYDEERFLGAVVGRALLEYRFVIDPRSFAYAFFDLGYVDRPGTPDLESSRALYPGYGIGIQFVTAVGLVNVSAALNPDSDPTEARIHVGLSFGL